jgi:hypothetical protein
MGDGEHYKDKVDLRAREGRDGKVKLQKYINKIKETKWMMRGN